MKNILAKQVVWSLSVMLLSFDFDYNRQVKIDVNIPDVNMKVLDNISQENINSGDDFDPTLPNTPPPEEVMFLVDFYSTKANIKCSRGVEKDLKDKEQEQEDKKDYYKIPYLDLVIKNAKSQKFDVELTLAIIKKESQFDPKAVSCFGAVGLMQLLPETASWLGLKDKNGNRRVDDELKNPDINIKYGIKYLRYLFSLFANNLNEKELSVDDASKQEFLKVLAAYNAGPGNVEKYDKPPYNGIPPFKETRNYVKIVPIYFKEFEKMSIPK